jgi:peptidoglycan L-alanyl-D-glutamate endopeptidase CwlK
MFIYGETSRAKLRTVHPALAAVATRALEISPFDITVVCGWRGEKEQNEAYAAGRSRVKWPDSKHNNTVGDNVPLSLAIDLAPYLGGQIPWTDSKLFHVLAGVVFAAAKERNVEIRWGGFFKGFQDLPHFELV